MGTTGIRGRILEIETELASIVKSEDSAVFRNLMLNLYSVLVSKEGLRYFNSIFSASGAAGSFIAKDTEDYLSELWLEAYKRYDPAKGPLLSFLTSRMKSRIVDDMRKANGIVGLPKDGEERKAVKITSIDEPVKRNGEEIRDSSILDKIGSGLQDSGIEDELSKSVIMDEQLHELASQILHFMDRKSPKNKKDKSDNTYLYYKLCYSTDIINYLKETCNTGDFRHERDTMGAMHFSFTNFCTDRQEPYSSPAALTAAAILRKKLARNGEVLPEDKVRENTREDRLAVPLQNEVVRGYLHRKEDLQISSAAVSKAVRKYRKDMHDRLLEKELSYADIFYHDSP